MDAGEQARELLGRSRLRASAWCGCCSVGLLGLAVLLLWAPASFATTPADTAATRTLLQAGYELDGAILHNAAASRSAVTSLAGHLGHECHGVLAGAPNEEAAPPWPGSVTPRASGEEQRSEQQLQTINSELSATVIAATYEPDRSAADAYVAQVSPLRWSDPQITALVQFDANSLEQTLTPPVANACTDMQTWAQSGYHVLSQSSREFQAAQTARSKAAQPESSISTLLKSYEQPSEQALIRKDLTLRRKIQTALARLAHPTAQLERALGIRETPFQERKSEPVVGRGKTSSGDSFLVRRESSGGAFARPSCRHRVSIELIERRTARGYSESTGTTVCLSGHGVHQPSTSCHAATESITAAVPASIRRVRLQLGNGRAITSSVVQIPRRDGGPGGVYVQVIDSARAAAVSLTELDSAGRVVLKIKLHRYRCRNESAASGPTFVNLATGTTPGGEEFTIQAVTVQVGHDQTSFSLSLGSPLSSRANTGEGSIGGKMPKAFPWQLGMECQPHEYAIIYGILAAPGASVMARTSTGLVPLTTVAVAPDLHSGGPLVYGVFSTLPTELVVLGSNGSTLYSESLATRGKEEAEFCEGYEEG